MNWQEIKLAALKKIDPAVTSLTPTRNTRDYLNAIIPAANRGLNDLSSVGKFLIRAYNVQIPDLQGAFTILETRQHLNEDIILESEGARAFSFEITGPANVKIYTGETLALEKEIKATSDFQTVKGKIPAGEENLAGGGDTEGGNANARPERKRSRGVQTVDTLRQPQRATTGRML